MRMEYEKVELVMRIISQDGRIDLPYEKVCLYIDSTLIIASCIKKLGEWIKKQNLDSRWIPVSVRYPDNAREVLVTIKRTENGKSRYMIDKAKCIHDIYTDRTVWDSYDYGAIGISNAKHMEVTAWIELPEPYMGE